MLNSNAWEHCGRRLELLMILQHLKSDWLQAHRIKAHIFSLIKPYRWEKKHRKKLMELIKNHIKWDGFVQNLQRNQHFTVFHRTTKKYVEKIVYSSSIRTLLKISFVHWMSAYPSRSFGIFCANVRNVNKSIWISNGKIYQSSI